MPRHRAGGRRSAAIQLGRRRTNSRHPAMSRGGAYAVSRLNAKSRSRRLSRRRLSRRRLSRRRLSRMVSDVPDRRVYIGAAQRLAHCARGGRHAIVALQALSYVYIAVRLQPDALYLPHHPPPCEIFGFLACRGIIRIFLAVCKAHARIFSAKSGSAVTRLRHEIRTSRNFGLRPPFRFLFLREKIITWHSRHKYPSNRKCSKCSKSIGSITLNQKSIDRPDRLIWRISDGQARHTILERRKPKFFADPSIFHAERASTTQEAAGGAMPPAA